MPAAIVTLADGRKARVTFDSPEQLDQAVSDLSAPARGEGKLFEREQGGHLRGPGDVLNEAIAEPALSMASGAVAGVAGGLAGVGTGLAAAGKKLVGGGSLQEAQTAGVDQAAQTIGDVSEKLTFQPKTKTGRKAAELAATPFTLLVKGADVAGQKAADVTGSPAVGAGVNTAIQALPGAVVPALRGAKRMIPRAAVEGAPAAPGPLQAAAGTPPAPETPLQAAGAARQSPSMVGEAQPQPGSPAAPPEPPAGLTASGPARQAPSEVGAGPAAAPRGTPAPNPEEAAQAYARNIGLDWARLGAGTRRALTTIAQDSTALDRLSPEAVKRQAHLGSLRVPVQATRGQLERDSVQLRREAIASNTPQGQPIRDVDIAANRDLQANLEVLRGRAGGLRGGLHEPLTAEGEAAATPSIRRDTKLPTQVGDAVQGAARKKALLSKRGYDQLYKTARETEPTAEASLAPITDLLKENPDIQHLGWVQSWLNKARSVKNLPEGQALEKVTLNELDDLRKLAGKHGQGTDAHFAGELRKAVDSAMDDVPEGAKAWSAARDAFRKHQKEFKDQGLVQKLVSQKKGGADRALALEKTWNQIATGQLEQVRQVKRSLMTGGDAATRTAGRKAWRDIRAETVNRILEDARNVTGADETERAILTEAALRRSIKRIPRENLEEILGKANVRELNDIVRARRITTRSPVGGRTTQSGTVPNMLALAEKVLSHIPGGKYAIGAKNLLKQAGEAGEIERSAKQAVVSPLEQAVRDVEATSRKRSREAAYRTLEGMGPTLSPVAPGSIGDVMRQQPAPDNATKRPLP